MYLYLKSSDFAAHDLDSEMVFDGCTGDDDVQYDLELVLKKYYSIDRSREMRCFVKNNSLIGESWGTWWAPMCSLHATRDISAGPQLLRLPERGSTVTDQGESIVILGN